MEWQRVHGYHQVQLKQKINKSEELPDANNITFISDFPKAL